MFSFNVSSINSFCVDSRLGKLPVPRRPTVLITVRQGSIALAVGADGGCLVIFTLICPFFPLSPSLWETTRYRLKYCLKGPLNPNQPTNQIIIHDLIAYLAVDRKNRTVLSFGGPYSKRKGALLIAFFFFFFD